MNKGRTLFAIGSVCLILNFVMKFVFRETLSADFALGAAIPTLLGGVIFMSREKGTFGRR